MSSKGPIFSQVVTNAKVGRGPVMGADGSPVDGSHRGVDLAVASGSSVTPAASGTVVFSGFRGQDYGNVVVIRHDLPGGKEVYSLYAHMESKPSVSVGEAVSSNTTLGQSGSTGRSTGPHVHFEMVEAQPGQASPVDKDGALGGYFSYKLLDPKTNPYGMLDWNPDQIGRNALTSSERLGQLKLSDAEFSTYKDQLASIETKGKSLDESYLTTSKSGEYLGRYQIGKSSGLIEAGYMDKAGNWTDYAKSRGVTSAQDFLNNPAAQDDALRNLTNKNAEFVVRNDLDLRVGDTVGETQLTGAGLLLGSHNSRGNLKSFVESDGAVDKGDGNNFQVSNFVAAGNKVTADGSTATTPAGGHWEYPTTGHNAMGDFPGAAEPVWVPDASTSTSKPTTTPSTDTHTPYTTHTITTPNPDGTTTTTGIAKGDSGDGFIAKGDAVSAVIGEDGKTLSEVVVHTTANGTEVKERIFAPDGDSATETYRQTDKDGRVITQITTKGDQVVGDSYTDKGVTYTRTQSDSGDVSWLDPNGNTPTERSLQGIEDSDLHITRRGAVPPGTETASVQTGQTDPNRILTDYKEVVRDGNTYTTGPNDTLNRPIPGQLGLFEVRNSDGSGSIVDIYKHTILAVLQPDDSVRMDGYDRIALFDVNGHAVDRTTESGRTGIFATTDQPAPDIGLNGSDAHLTHYPPPATDNTDTGSNSETNKPAAPAEPAQPATNPIAPLTQQQINTQALINAQVTDAGTALSFANSLIGLKNWGAQNDLGHLSTLVGTYNTYARLGSAVAGLGTDVLSAPGASGLEQFGAGINLITSLQSGNPIAIASSGAALYNSFASAANAIPLPVINILNIGSALQNGDPFAIASSVASCFPPWGTVASVVISIIGSMVQHDIPPPPDGAVHYIWDETGAIQIQTDHDVSGGAKTAQSTAGNVLGLLQSVVSTNNEKNDAGGQSNNNLGIDPSRLPRIGFTAGMSWLEITHADGSTTKETINPATIGERLVQVAIANDALAPAWQIQTAQAHAQTAHAEAVQAQAQATHAQVVREAEVFNASAIDGQTHTVPGTSNTGAWDMDGHAPVEPAAIHNTVETRNNAAVFGVKGTAAEAADHKTQTFNALVVHLHSPGAQDAIDAMATTANGTPTTKTSTVLHDVDNDGFWEQTQWVAGQDDAGNAQGMLVLDHNHNGVIDTADILHTGGDATQRNSLDWLDANVDGKLDASDPAFAAIKVWVDSNSDGRVQDGEMQTPQLSSINFTTGQITYTNGPSATLSATTLKADTEGRKIEQLKVVGVDGKLHELDAGNVTVREGYEGQVRVNSKGQIVQDGDPDTDTHWVSKRTNSYEQDAKRTGDWEGTADQALHRHGGGNVAGAPTQTSATGATSIGAVLGKDNVITYTTMEEGDERLVSDAPQPAGTAANTVTITLNVGDARIRSLTPQENAKRVVFVPPGAGGLTDEEDEEDLLHAPSDGLFGAGGMAGALMAVALGAVQTTAFAKPDFDEQGFAWQSTPLMPGTPSASTTGQQPDSSSAGAGADQASTILLGNYATVHHVHLGVLISAPPLASAPAAGYVPGGADAGATRGSGAPWPTSAYVYSNTPTTFAPDGSAWPAQPVIYTGNGSPSTPSTPTAATTTTDRTPDSQTTPPDTGEQSTTTPTPPTASFPPSPTLVATPPTAPSAISPTTAGDHLSNPQEDTALHVGFATLMANDTNASTITAVGNAAHGSVAIVGGEVVFTPSANYSGPASFVYQVVSTDGNFALGEASFDVSAVNDLPVVLGETATATEDSALVQTQATLLANDNDVDVATDGQVLRISAVGNATHGTVSILGNGSVQFTPTVNYHGAASFDYVVNDGNGGTATATATVQVAAVNDVPVVLGEAITSNEDTTLLISQAALLANDTDADVATDGQVLRISAVSNASHGTVSILGNGSIQFIPDANYAGNASFDYVVNDGAGGTATATAFVQVGAVDDAPLASGETVNSQEDQVVTLTAAALLANETDVDNAVSTLQISRVLSGSGGTTVLNASGNVVFTPTADFSGTATLTYWVKDPNGLESNPATVTLNVAPVNDAPYAQGENVSGASEDAVFTINKSILLANDGDVEDAWYQLNIELVGNASAGTGTVALDGGGNVVYTPAANFNGPTSFQYLVRDSSGAASPVVTAQIQVAAVNDVPIGVDDQFPIYTNALTTIGFNQLVGNDTDVDNPPSDLTVGGVRNAVNGTAVIAGGQVTFTPALNFNGMASFEYQVDDQHGGQTWATAVVTVAPPPNHYPSVNVTYANFYPTGSTPAGAFDMGDVSFSLADDGNPGLVSITYLGGSYHVFGDPGGAVASVPWNMFTYSQTSWNFDIPRSSALDAFDTTWRVVDDRGLANIWHFGYTVGSGTRTSTDFTGWVPPVVLALNGDSPHYIETRYSNVHFDLNGDGVADQVAWAAPGSGVLGIDLNGDHQISNASEFAFAQYVPGAKTDLEGLRAFDTNHNGVLDAGDAKWAQFGVWEDKNSDGITQDGEYQTLDTLGIANINLSAQAPAHAPAAPADGHLTGMAVMGESTFTRTDGGMGQVADAMFGFVVAPPELSSQAAEVMRMALLFNQVCNTASDGDHAALGFVPIQTDGHWQDTAFLVPHSALHEAQLSA